MKVPRDVTVSQGPGNVFRAVGSPICQGRGHPRDQTVELKIGRSRQRASTRSPAGIASAPIPGPESRPVGSSVTLFLSSGRGRAPLPDVPPDSLLGHAALTNAGFLRFPAHSDLAPTLYH